MIIYIKDILENLRDPEPLVLEDIFGMDVSHIIQEHNRFDPPLIEKPEPGGKKENRPDSEIRPAASLQNHSV